MTTTSMPSHRNSIPFASWCPLPTKSILSWMSSSSRLCFSRYAGLTSRQLSKLYQYLEAKCCAPCPGHSLTCLGLVQKKNGAEIWHAISSHSLRACQATTWPQTAMPLIPKTFPQTSKNPRNLQKHKAHHAHRYGHPHKNRSTGQVAHRNHRPSPGLSSQLPVWERVPLPLRSERCVETPVFSIWWIRSRIWRIKERNTCSKRGHDL